jgi:hypothetical protein
MLEQLDLFAGAKPKRARRPRTAAAHPAPYPRLDSPDATFAAMIKARPDVWQAYHRHALEMLARGVHRIGSKALFELVRVELAPIKLNNNLTAAAARHLLKIDPRFHGLVELRERRRA